jgi:hypothetical protein
VEAQSSVGLLVDIPACKAIMRAHGLTPDF